MKIGACLIHDRKHEKAMTLLQEAMVLLEGSEFYNSFLIADIHFNMGIVHCETGELNKAIDSYEISMRLKRDKLGDESIEIAQVSLGITLDDDHYFLFFFNGIAHLQLFPRS